MITVLPLGVTTTVWAERVAKTGSSSPFATMIFFIGCFGNFPDNRQFDQAMRGDVRRDAETDADGFILVLGNRHASYVVNDTALREWHQTPD